MNGSPAPEGASASEPAAPAPGAGNPPEGERARVLFMDDEEVLCEMVSAMLEHLGYEPMTASDGAEAIRLFVEAREAGWPISVVIMDLTIPGGMGGYEAAQRLRKIDPAARVVVSSGYSNDPIMADFRSYGFVGSIAKPYQLEELEETVRQALAGGR